MLKRLSLVTLVVNLVALTCVGAWSPSAAAQDGKKGSAAKITNPATPTPADEPTPAQPQVEQSPAATPAPAPLSQPSTVGPNVVAPPAAPVISTPVSTSRSSSSNNSPFSPRLARAAPIMGDTLSPSLLFQDELGSGRRELPQGGGATRSKIAENSSSLPMDRLIFNYNHFHNAVDENLVDSSDIDRFTLGFEKTFFDQMASIEVRMPFVADNDFAIPGDFSRNGSEVGNLSVTLKSVLTSSSDRLLAAGLTIDTPTGGGTTLINDGLAPPLTVDIDNDAVHLSPFLGFLCAPGNGIAHQAFIQVDVATNANGLTFTDAGGTFESELLEQTLLYIDYSYSKELMNAGRVRSGISRVLGLLEFHYTTTLEDSDVISITGTPLTNTGFEVTSAGNRLDVVNMTLGLHTEFANGTQLRLGTVAPLSTGDDRFFDFEFQAQVNILLR